MDVLPELNVPFLVCFFVTTDEEETARAATRVGIGEATDGRVLNPRPITTVAIALRKTSGMAVGKDKRNGHGRRGVGK